MAEPRAEQKKTATVIYRPEDGDKIEVTVGATERDPGIRFRANIAQEVPYARTVMQLVTVKRDMPDGTTQSRGVEKAVPLVEMLKNNPAFEVDGVRAERKAPFAKPPETPNEYRGYAIAWITASMSAKAIELRWEGETGLRERCGVNKQDLAYLLPYLDARKKECAELDDMRAA